jgi:hypothetical protein
MGGRDASGPGGRTDPGPQVPQAGDRGGEASDRGGADAPVGPGLVVDVAVSGAPEGKVRYQLVVDGERTSILWREPDFWPAQVALRSDYATMAGIAKGDLSALDALSAGRARLSGDISALSTRQPALGGLDLLPPAVRAGTTF